MEQKKTIIVTLESKEIKFDVMNKSHLTARHEMQRARIIVPQPICRRVKTMNMPIRFYAPSAMLSHILRWNSASICTRMARHPTTASIRQLRTAASCSFHSCSRRTSTTLPVIASAGCSMSISLTDLSEWFVITDKQDAQDYANLATDALDRAKQALYKRERPTRPTYND